jgi:hypothetical protein
MVAKNRNNYYPRFLLYFKIRLLFIETRFLNEKRKTTTLIIITENIIVDNTVTDRQSPTPPEIKRLMPTLVQRYRPPHRLSASVAGFQTDVCFVFKKDVFYTSFIIKSMVKNAIG